MGHRVGIFIAFASSPLSSATATGPGSGSSKLPITKVELGKAWISLLTMSSDSPELGQGLKSHFFHWRLRFPVYVLLTRRQSTRPP